MSRYVLPAAVTALWLTAPFTLQAQESVSAADMIALFEKLGGNHKGQRRAHARGVCASGTFTPQTAEGFSSAALLNNGELPVTARFSLGGGDPNADERTPGTRGGAFQITLPDGSAHYIVGNNFPVFAGKDPDTFYGFLSSLLPDEKGQRDPQKTMQYVKSHPSVQAHVAWQQTAKTPASFANTAFFGIHTFYFDNQGVQTKFRWTLEPELGVKTLEATEAQQMPAAFLADRLAKQVAEGNVSFTLKATLGAPEDSDIDPSQQWPAERPQVVLGKITLNASGGDNCTAINFDPNRLSAGFSPSEDPVLRMRSPAYAISFGKRLTGQ